MFWHTQPGVVYQEWHQGLFWKRCAYHQTQSQQISDGEGLAAVPCLENMVSWLSNILTLPVSMLSL